jgi:hypothetical protein
VKTLTLTAKDVPMAKWRPGLVEYDGVVYMTYSRRRAKPGGWILNATASDGSGGWDSEPVCLVYANETGPVRLLEKGPS